MIKPYRICLDPGKRQDPASVQIWRLMPILDTRPTSLYCGREIWVDHLVKQLKYADRDYTVLAEQMIELTHLKALSAQCTLIMDCTGVGEPLKDLIRRLGGTELDFFPIQYTSGGEAHFVEKKADPRFSNLSGNQQAVFKTLDHWAVPKADLVEAAKLASEDSMATRIVRGVAYLNEFEQQMMKFRGKIRSNGYISYDNEKDTDHDDWTNCYMMRSWHYRKNMKNRSVMQDRPYTRPDEVANVLGDI